MRNESSDKAYEYIRRRIFSGEFSPGYRLKTNELTKEIGTSATPVRDALRILEREGLVEIRPQLGASVKSLDILGFKELCEVRCALECLAAELAAENRTEMELADIVAALENMKAIVETTSDETIDESQREKLRQEDMRFHLAILVATHNETLYNEVLRLQALHRILSPVGKEKFASLREVYDCHRRICEAIQVQDADAARKAMKEHIQAIVDRAVLAMTKSERRKSIARLAEEHLGYLE